MKIVLRIPRYFSYGIYFLHLSLYNNYTILPLPKLYYNRNSYLRITELEFTRLITRSLKLPQCVTNTILQ